ncbi:MAG TPA: class I SAM-dependent methyltransferase [Acidimicrobiales bacterium]|nr:class I SAM-dependent methyltransferase [Acidimicrobiales bacterium]
MNSQDWDTRYSAKELIWTSTPNQFLVSEIEGLAPTTALDLACGEGRNAIWLAEKGWKVTGVDFSQVGLEKAKTWSKQRNVDIDWIHYDAISWTPPSGGFGLVAVFYLQLEEPDRTSALRVATSAVASGGTLLVVAHDITNLKNGYGGPQDPRMLYAVEDVTTIAEAAGLQIVRGEQLVRVVDTDSGPKQAIDLLVRATRP